ncbi:MAG: V-type ATP synthase subunit D [Candidatus Heimdallarchaeota archaeon]|nr:V-type ATP synthase subunit D [Candidatus Heimdallarchaeota archaeon]MDH5644594.1 V-type ATP synthase subunit D [Candidatus Heimdallarchaeota archaeon]
MSTDNRVRNVPPTRMQLLLFKNKVKLATHGHDLLKEKMDALIIEFYNVLEEVKDAQSEADEVLTKAHEQLGVASFKLGTYKLKEIGFSAPETMYLHASTRNIMGVKTPKLSVKKSELPYPFYNAESTSSALDDTITAFRSYIYSVVVLAEKIATLQKLAYEINNTKRRVNALNHIIIPRLKNTARFIDIALEEEEREQFSRMKFVKNRLQGEAEVIEVEL